MIRTGKGFWRTALCGLLCLSITAAACACSPAEEDKPNMTVENDFPEEGIDYGVTYYDNDDFNDYTKEAGETSTVSDQWENYGIGDPFVMRWNGMYYLYVSTKDGEYGVKMWTSPDLVHWTYYGDVIDHEDGATHASTLTAYAPEVYYFNGTFYLYQSQGGNGHYIYTADSPEGPFVVASGNVGYNIDGSIFIDDEENIYFLYASSGTITMSRVNDMVFTSRPAGTGTISAASNVGGWTEGPDLFCVNGNYYLTYTGTNVASDGYRVLYASTDTFNNASMSSIRNTFRTPANNPLLLNTEIEEGAVGTGHSSTVMGPDLDSYYIVYHNLNSSGGPNRSLNIDRLLFSGTYMTTSANRTGSVAPAMPVMFSRDVTAADSGFTASGSYILSDESTADAYTVEFNSAGNGVRYIVSYASASDYAYVTVDYTAKTISLVRVSGGSESTVASGTLVHDFSAADNHTIRVVYADGVMNVYFDDLNKIADAPVTLSGGKIGYFCEGTAAYGYTAFSDHAYGSSDNAEVTQALGETPASAYIPEGKYEGLVSYRLGSGSGVEVIAGTDENETDALEREGLLGAKLLTLSDTGDFTRYAVNFKESGFYGIAMLMPAEYCDGTHRIGVQIDGGDVLMVTVPSVNTVNRYVRLIVTELSVEAGIHTVKFENVGTGVGFVAFAFVETSATSPSYSQDLSAIVDRGSNYQTIWKIRDDPEGDKAHYAADGSRQLLYFGDNTFTDFTLEVDIALAKSTGTSNAAGILLRGGNYAGTNDIGNYAIQGYYLAIYEGSIVLVRANYGETAEVASVPIDSAVNTYYNIRAVVRGNSITIYRDDEVIINYTDAYAFVSGRIGLYTTGAASYYKNLTVSA